jgi:Tfp pilus assembly protein PilP
MVERRMKAVLERMNLERMYLIHTMMDGAGDPNLIC